MCAAHTFSKSVCPILGHGTTFCAKRQNFAKRKESASQNKRGLVTLEEFVEERRRFIRDADDLVRCLTIEFEIELGPGSAVIPVGEMFEIAPPQRPLRERGASDGEAHTRRLPRDAGFFAIASAEVTTPRAMRPWPPSFSLANTNTVSPSAICLPPYIVFCAVNANVFARGSLDRERHASPLVKRYEAPPERKRSTNCTVDRSCSWSSSSSLCPAGKEIEHDDEDEHEKESGGIFLIVLVVGARTRVSRDALALYAFTSTPYIIVLVVVLVLDFLHRQQSEDDNEHEHDQENAASYPYWAVQPPSMRISVPVMKAASSEHR